MDNASAIAGIADGNGYDISGKLINPKDKTTLLTAGAQLSSTQDKVTGYIARNGATLNNTGNIIFTGKNTVGVRVEGGLLVPTAEISYSSGWWCGTNLLMPHRDVTTINNCGKSGSQVGDNANRTTGV
ncbi:hypothetical protein O5623_28755 [Escherichia coli]|nr:hypothetical protein [Escherichia coli]